MRFIPSPFLCLRILSLLAGIVSAHAWLPSVTLSQKPSPTLSQDALKVRDGYRVELVASEPLIVDPVTARLDHRGRLWVVEMPDYPLGPPSGQGPGGRIKILHDDDSDGRFDRATRFADGLMFATGVQPYRDGAIVTWQGQIVFMHDRNGDGIADDTEPLFEGFAEQNQQLRANHPTLGPDGLIYVAGGLRGGKIRSLSERYDDHDEVDLRDRDFCFDPDGGWWGAVAGKSQFGISIDDFGRRFGCSNRNPAMTAPLSLTAVQRDPLLTPRDAIHDVALAGPASKVVSIGEAWTTSNLHAGQFSAACGVFAPGFEDKSGEWLLACEPTAYLVQRQRIHRQESVWSARREPVSAEFLASSNTWFRPVDLTSGPGQSIYVIDMARAVIEHPDFMPTELKSRPDMRLGDDLGRIWRVESAAQRAVGKGLKSGQQALTWLDSDSPWQRQMATQFLLESGPQSVATELGRLVRSPSTAPRARARAAWMLDRCQSLSEDELSAMMASHDPRLRALGIRLAAAHPEMRASSLSLASDSDPLVVRRVAASAAAASDGLSENAAALVAIALAFDDPWIHRTIASSRAELVPMVAERLAQSDAPPIDLLCHLIKRLAIAMPDRAATVAIEFASVGGDRRLRDLIGVLDAWRNGLSRAKHSLGKQLDALPPDQREQLNQVLDQAARSAADSAQNPDDRADYITVTNAFGRAPQDLRPLLATTAPTAVRVSALPILLRRDPAWTHRHLRDHLMGMPISERQAAIAACCRDVRSTQWLLATIEEGVIPRTVIDPTTSKRLQQHSDKLIRESAQRLLKSDSDRVRVVADYSGSAQQLGDATLGKTLFKEHCSACHRIDGVGTNVGPDISDTRTKTAEALLVAILDPNAAIDSSFVQYQVLTTDGRLLDGLLIDETADAITLQQKGDQRITISRSDIESTRAPGVSLMPEGFERSLTIEAMSHLLSYLKNWRYLGTEIPVPSSAP